MAPHPNPKREKFCQEWCRTREGKAAAIGAGYSPKTARSTAYELRRDDPLVQERIAELDAEYLAEVQRDAANVLRMTLAQAETGLGAFLRFDEHGDPVIDLASATREQIDTLGEVTVETYVEPGEGGRAVKRVKIKAGDRNKAIDRLWGYTRLDATQAETEAGALASAIDQLARVRGSSMPVNRGDDEGEA